MAVCRKREFYGIWKQSWNKQDRKKYCDAKIDVKRGKNGQGSEGSGLVEKTDVVGVSCHSDESKVLNVSVDDGKKSGRCIWKS